MKITPVVAALAASPIQAGWQGGNPAAGGQAVLPVSVPLSDVEGSTLTLMREEEKLARDVYLTLFDAWKHPVFSNISAAEQRHMDNMKRLLDIYGLVDPVVDDTVGVFTNTNLAAMYQELVSKGEVSLEDALYMGALIEELDITDLNRAIAESTHADVTKAYENLMRGSRNHLRAFVRQIENMGIVYEAQVMSQEEVDEIINSAVERGGKGRGKWRGGR